MKFENNMCVQVNAGPVFLRTVIRVWCFSDRVS